MAGDDARRLLRRLGEQLVPGRDPQGALRQAVQLPEIGERLDVSAGGLAWLPELRAAEQEQKAPLALDLAFLSAFLSALCAAKLETFSESGFAALFQYQLIRHRLTHLSNPSERSHCSTAK
jgi:hypothetical protein